jgi:site-specific recombinase XerD
MTREELFMMPQLVREFANYMHTINDKSQGTIDEYLLDLRTFFRFLVARDKKIEPSSEDFEKLDISKIDLDYIKNITQEDIYEFLMYADGVRGNMAAAKSRKLSAIKGFFKYLTVKRMMLDENPAANIESPKKKQALPKYLSLEDSIQLLDSVDGNNKERDFCILTLFLNCGLRLSELCGINLSDISGDGRLRVLGKGRKERIIFLNSACTDAIDSYLRVRPNEGVTAEHKNALFISRNKRRISNKTVQHIVYTFLDKAGLGGMGISPHKLRHTAATLMYQEGHVDIRALKEVLGHANLNTTQIYTHLSNQHIKEAIEANPLAKIKK